ncbi:MAG: hypothetical protein Q8M92_04605 [Candidatus Subteraquimicrobiales bacterium]|nr:hypothetical protein [Candidatus Subteraquimicrobiales bacterium]
MDKMDQGKMKKAAQKIYAKPAWQKQKIEGYFTPATCTFTTSACRKKNL